MFNLEKGIFRAYRIDVLIFKRAIILKECLFFMVHKIQQNQHIQLIRKWGFGFL